MIHHSDQLAAELMKRTYETFVDRIAGAEVCATADDWLQLIDDWNAFNAFVWSEMIRCDLRASSGRCSDAEKAESDRISIEVFPALDAQDHKLFGPLITRRHRPAVELRYGTHFLEKMECKLIARGWRCAGRNGVASRDGSRISSA